MGIADTSTKQEKAAWNLPQTQPSLGDSGSVPSSPKGQHFPLFHLSGSPNTRPGHQSCWAAEKRKRKKNFWWGLPGRRNRLILWEQRPLTTQQAGQWGGGRCWGHLPFLRGSCWIPTGTSAGGAKNWTLPASSFICKSRALPRASQPAVTDWKGPRCTCAYPMAWKRESTATTLCLEEISSSYDH